VEFAGAHGLVSWVVPGAIAQARLLQAAGRKEQALESLKAALSAAAPAGLYRIFVDEYDALQPLLEQVRSRLKDRALVQYLGRLLAAAGRGNAKPAALDDQASLLSERELEVLQHLAKGLSYEEVGRKLFLSLNTVQFHVKNIYSKLLVHRRVQAIERAREMGLI
jgi:LuxR family maltose regulon positive regulatory protein